MIKKILLVLAIIITSVAIAQNKALKGQIVDAATQKPLESAHVLNLNSVVGSISDKKGMFEIQAKAKDTVLVSYVGFESIKLKVTNDLLKGNELVIALNEKPEEIKQVVVKSTKLIGILEVDVKKVPKDRFTRIHIDGIKQTYEIGKKYESPSFLSKIMNPVDLVYNLFGKKPQQLRKLKKLKKEDGLRKMFAEKYNREVMMEYLEMDRNQLSKLLSDCNYSEYFIKKASDLQMIEAILNCYENYKAVKKGKINQDKIPDRIN